VRQAQVLLEAARITDQAGVDAIGAKGFKEVIKMIESKDSDVRNATLDALVAAFSQAKYRISSFQKYCRKSLTCCSGGLGS